MGIKLYDKIDRYFCKPDDYCKLWNHTKKGELIEYYRVEAQKPYDDVLAEIKIAIAEHNLRITAHSPISEM